MIFGLTGYAGAGKDTAADYLVEHHGFVRVAFADKLREFCFRADPKIQTENGIRHLTEYVNEVGYEKAKRECIDFREFMQRVGHGARLTFGDQFWIERALTEEILRNERIVVTDVRYANEVEYVANLDGFIVRIEREGVGPVNDHITEQPLPFDYKIQNPNRYMPGLYSNLDELVYNLSRITD